MGNTDNQRNPAWDATLSLFVKPGAFTYFLPILQKGVAIEVEVGCTIKQLLEEQIGLTPDYVEKRIQTIFLDAKPVDDLGSAVIRDGATLTLSAAMPGLLGAMLRKNSVCAALRSQITHMEEKGAPASGKGLVMLRLFNFLGREVGPTLLKQGVGVSGEDLQDFLGQGYDPLWGEVEKLVLNGEGTDVKGLREKIWSDKQVFLELHDA